MTPTDPPLLLQIDLSQPQINQFSPTQVRYTRTTLISEVVSDSWRAGNRYTPGNRENPSQRPPGRPSESIPAKCTALPMQNTFLGSCASEKQVNVCARGSPWATS